MNSNIADTWDTSQAVRYHYDKFPPQNLDYARLLDSLAKASAAIARFDQMLKNVMHNSEILLAPLRNQEAVISSRMEGTVSTIDEILRYEAEYDDETQSQYNVRSDVVETYLYQRALKNAQHALEQGQPLSAWLIKAAHQSLLSFGRGATKSPGNYKTEQNYLADKPKKKILFVPIKPDMLQIGLDKLFDYIKDSPEQILIRTSVSHVEFEALHPFEDGNGRIGRMLITLMLWQANVISKPHFYISGYLEEHKDLYIDLMRGVSQDDNWTEWCLFFLDALEAQANRNLEVAEAIQALYNEMKVVFTKLLKSKWSVITLDFVFANPIFKNTRFVTETRVSDSTSSKFMKLLTDAELISVIQEPSGRRPALYAFEPLLRLVRV
ncbi:Fic family protein [Hydromonas duriensis]|uniref:Fic family protein n=1 Tax=Hydromonas duriensis TaxID=1527608 RepID=A0A4R6Y1J3_9BURK|nr:Fic/DOC family N-terminal domain-containing protein [Hydromonas duriensis]TDR30254.1 Fic family protein [Hydromonas duriensis]